MSNESNFLLICSEKVVAHEMSIACSLVVHSMDVHPSRELVASGQRAGTDRKSQAHVRIWSTESLQTLYVFGMGELNVGVSAVAFSQLVSQFFLVIISQHIQTTILFL